MNDKYNNYLNHFAIALRKNLAEMANLSCQIGDPKVQVGSFISEGLAVIIGITGKRAGRIIIDTDKYTAKKLSELINQEEGIDEQLVIDTMAEFTNIVSGHTITLVNNINKGMNLMLTPPSLFIGNKITIVSPKINAQIIEIKTEVGFMVVSVGFEGGVQ